MIDSTTVANYIKKLKLDRQAAIEAQRIATLPKDEVEKALERAKP